MSTYWYFECLDHDPLIRSDDEFTQHTDDHAFKNALQLAYDRPLIEQTSEEYFEANALRFLKRHPFCELAISSEYGERRTGVPELKRQVNAAKIISDSLREGMVK